MKFVREGYVETADGLKLWYGVSGNPAGTGVPIVCANGIGCSHYFWKYVRAHFGPDAPVLVWDYRGHGKSSVPEDRKTTVRECAEDMRLVMDAAGIAEAALIGHSMGCQVVLEFYRLFPERSAAVIPLLGSYGKPLDTFFDTDVARRVLPYLHKFVSAFPGLAGTVVEKALHPGLSFEVAHQLGIINGALADINDMTDYFAHIAQVPVDLFLNLAADAGDHTCEDILGEIECPVLIIGGERDKFTPVWLSHKMHKAIPGSEMLIIREGSHAAIIEQPDLINLRLEKFLRERVTGARRPAAKASRAKTPRLKAARRKAPAKGRAAKPAAKPKARRRKVSAG